jgi:hypothetical protein
LLVLAWRQVGPRHLKQPVEDDAPQPPA